jgi:hypothetical protein
LPPQLDTGQLKNKNRMSIAARPVALAIEILDAIEGRLCKNPPTPDSLNLEMKVREARVLALHEAPIRADAVGKQGPLLQLLELDAAVDDTIVLDDVASKMKKAHRADPPECRSPRAKDRRTGRLTATKKLRHFERRISRRPSPVLSPRATISLI